MERLLALVGMCGSGKSQVGEYLKEMGYQGIYFGRITMEWLENLGLEINPSNERRAREAIREKHGMAAYAKLSIKKITEAEQYEKVFIDGLYSFEEYELLEKEFATRLCLIEVYADKKIRHSRLQTRPHRPLTLEESRERDFSEIKKLNKGGAIALSDYKISNNGSIKELENNLKNLLDKLNQ